MMIRGSTIRLTRGLRTLINGIVKEQNAGPKESNKITSYKVRKTID